MRQYTLRNIPTAVDEALRRRSRESGKSFNQVAVDALTVGAGQSTQVYDDLDFLIGSMTTKDAKTLAREVAAQRRVDPKLWK